MNRDDVSYNLEKIKKATVSSSRTFHHIAKVLEFVIYELDGLKAREAEAPSVYYESRDGEADFNYEDYPPEEEEDINESVDLTDVEISESYIDDTNLPLVIAYDGLATPFRMDDEQHEEEGKGKEELPKEEGEKSEAVHPDESRTTIDGAIGFVSFLDE